MSNFVDLTGQVFGRLTVVSRAANKGKHTRWDCLCQCGKKTTVHGDSLKRYLTKSCGCLNSEMSKERSTIHNGYGTTEYKSWSGMKERCYNKKHLKYQTYGRRGIIVCDRWLNSFEHFLLDMGNKPKGKHSIDRENNDGNYEPSNCRWATSEEQANNTRNTKKITFHNVTLSYSQWSRKLGGNSHLVSCRVKRGWSEEKAVSTPIRVVCKQIRHK